MSAGLLGGVSLLASLFFSVLGLAFSGLAYRFRDTRYLEAAKRAAPLVFAGLAAAFLALEWALITHDFSVKYVALHHSVKDPLWVTLVTPWAALEGSILLWATLQSLYTWLVSRAAGKQLDVWRAPIALATLFGIQVFFVSVMVFMVNPFTAVAQPPLDGNGPNPLLQNHWMMAVHPVLMYLGFVGLSVPFAYAVSSMVVRRYQSWVHETRFWTLVAWGFLTAAIFAGGWWSYEVLGWGGYWAFDPVENASIIPWFLATAFLHTVQVQERRGLFKAWNFSFITLAFAATVFGTFLTRSGVIQSVHAFASGPIGVVFLGFLLLVLVVGFGLLSKVSAELKDAGEIRFNSREGALLGGALLFGTFAFVILVGTLWPLVVEAASGAKVSVGAPFFFQVSIPLGVALLLLMGAGPVLPWRNAGTQVRRNLFYMGLSLGLGTGIGLALGLSLGVSLALGLFLYNLAAVALMFSQGIAERGTSLKISALQAFLELAATNKRRFGSHVVHVGVALAGLAIAVSQTYRIESEKTLRLSEVWNVAGLEVRLLPLTLQEESNRQAIIAPLKVRSTSRLSWGAGGSYQPRLNFYPSSRTPLAAPHVRYSLFNDYYFVLQEFDRDKGAWATIRLIVTPMVLWLWISGALIALGTLYLLLPNAAGFKKGATAPSA